MEAGLIVGFWGLAIRPISEHKLTVDGRTLTFAVDVTSDGGQALVDQQTGTTWEPLTGIGLSGELEGTVLRRLPTTYSFWFAWTDFYPDTKLYVG